MVPTFTTRCTVSFAPVLLQWGLIAIKPGLGFVVLVILSMVSPTVRADSILLRGGERLIGRVLLEEEGKIQFESQALGVMEIPRDRIERIERDAPPPPPEPVAPESATKATPPLVPAQPAAGPVPADPAKDSIVPAPPAETPASPVGTAAKPAESAKPSPSAATAAFVTKEANKDAITPAPPPEPPVSPAKPVRKQDAVSTASPTILPAAPAAIAEVKEPAAPSNPPVPSNDTTAPVVAQIKPSPAAPTPTVASTPTAAPEVTIVIQPAASPASVVAVSPAEPAQAGVAPTTASLPPPVTVTTVFYPWSGLLTEQDTFDWIQLKSGEWLKGEIKSMQEETLEFDSEEMDYREIDWEDVTILRSPRLNSVWFEQAGTSDGSLLITPKEVRVVSKSGTNIYPRTDLLAITHTGDKEFQKWSGEVSLGFNVRTGNAEEVSYNAHINLQRRTPKTRLIFDYLGNFSRINGQITSDNLRETTTFDYFLSRKFYIRFPDAEIYRDPLQNIARRLTLGASVGYDFIRTSKVEWDLSAGPAYQNITYDSVEPGASAEEESATLVISSHLEIALTKRIDWTLDYRGQLTGKEAASGNSQHVNSTLEFDIHKRLNLDISAIWDHVGSPKTDTGGTTPSSDDFRIITSLGIDF